MIPTVNYLEIESSRMECRQLVISLPAITGLLFADLPGVF
jgi:hypothetical protein